MERVRPKAFVELTDAEWKLTPVEKLHSLKPRCNYSWSASEKRVDLQQSLEDFVYCEAIWCNQSKHKAGFFPNNKNRPETVILKGVFCHGQLLPPSNPISETI